MSVFKVKNERFPTATESEECIMENAALQTTDWGVGSEKGQNQ